MAHIEAEDAEIEEILDGDDDDADNDVDPGPGMENPVLTREQERMNEPRLGTRGPPMVKRQLAAVWDEQGAVKVAVVVGGRQQEPFRDPTAAEWAALKARGYFVKGGLSEAATTTSGGIQPNWGKIIVVGGVVLVGGVFAYQKAKEYGLIGGGQDDGDDVEYRVNGDDDEGDEEDDVEDEDDGE